MEKRRYRHSITVRAGIILLCLVLTLGLAGTIPAGNAEAASRSGAVSISATLSPDITIVVDGVTQTFYNVQGSEVHPVLYNGTTYLPVRAIGELMDKNVNWDQSTLTATLSSPRTTGRVNGTPDNSAVPKTISAQIRSDFTIVVDGTVRHFTDVNGNTVYPLLYEGTTYLPLRAIGELMNKNVQWNSTTRTATLSAKASDVTDADSFNNTNTGTNTGANTGVNTGTNSGTYIGEEKAKSIALNHAGLTENQVTFVRVRMDYDDGRREYEVEFYNKNSFTEYDYEIDAVTGRILSVDYDAEYYAPSAGTGTNGQYISRDEAKSIALGRAGISASQAVFKKAEFDFDDGRAVYEIEFFSGNLEYEFEIDASTGNILSYERDSRWD